MRIIKLPENHAEIKHLGITVTSEWTKVYVFKDGGMLMSTIEYYNKLLDVNPCYDDCCSSLDPECATLLTTIVKEMLGK